MRNQELTELLRKFAIGQASDEDREILNSYLQNIDDQRYEEVLCIYHDLLDDDIDYDFNGTDLLARIKLKVFSSSASGFGYKWYSVASAAVVLFIIGLTFFLFNIRGEKQGVSGLAEAESFSMGANKAVLTLANGQQINLNDASNGEIANQSGVTITKAANGQLIYNIDLGASPKAKSGKIAYNTVTTPKGGQYQVNLPDGTRVWLNAASSLSYPAQFSENERRVVLNGEAYFEVAQIVLKKSGKSNKRVPFLVQTANQEVEVLGTHFNINAYADEPATKTTLLEGSVRVMAKEVEKDNWKGNHINILKPGEQSLLEQGNMTVRNVESADAIAWKDGYLQFQDESIRSIMRKIERAYDVEVNYEGEINNEEIGGMVSKLRNLPDILKALTSAAQCKFKVEGRRITVMP